jgi:ABC-type dipeptide/oligopeptide/nickel transport system ATPase subunit
MSAPIIEARGLNVVFGRSGETFHAVRDADFVAYPGEAVGVVGESGSGKTTLARVLAGLQPPTSGSVVVDGQPVYEDGAVRKVTPEAPWRLQMIFQDPYSSLNPRMTARAAVSEAVHVWHGTGRKESDERAMALLSAMGLSPEHTRQFPRSLSGGQRQRVSVARALAPDPRVLIADEPTSAIDQSAQAQLLNLFRRLQAERGLTIVFISHDLSLVRYLTARVYVMQRGVVVEHGETAAVFENPAHAYTRELIDSIPRRKEYAT